MDNPDFDNIWNKLAKQGKCDGLGGSEYRRVYQEYRSSGYIEDTEDFIIKRANELPKELVDRIDKFKKMYPESRAVIPESYSAELKSHFVKSTKENES